MSVLDRKHCKLDKTQSHPEKPFWDSIPAKAFIKLKPLETLSGIDPAAKNEICSCMSACITNTLIICSPKQKRVALESLPTAPVSSSATKTLTLIYVFLQFRVPLSHLVNTSDHKSHSFTSQATESTRCLSRAPQNGLPTLNPGSQWPGSESPKAAGRCWELSSSAKTNWSERKSTSNTSRCFHSRSPGMLSKGYKD